MQAVLNLAASPVFSYVPPAANNSPKLPTGFQSTKKLTTTIGVRPSVKAAAAVAVYETVDYSSTFSVFPAEACETIGGDACLADIYPEVKLQMQDTRSTIKITRSELVEREYFQYTNPKTVLLGEACDVLGGEFCERPYQKGIY
ncbi:hypothetical protein ACH5RR_014589 [Cinchona calisaya]|uniref:Light-regulated protein n=1 Tax=Cinchona calisaya TaxID=153742 RepID=A0ABD3A6X0_9GENT